MGLSALRTSAVLSLVGVVLTFLVSYILFGDIGLFLGNSSNVTVSDLENVLTLYFLIAIAALLLGIGNVVLIRKAFVRFRENDTRFANTPTYAVVVFVGLVFLILALLLVLGFILALITCAVGSATVPSTCVSLGSFVGALALSGIGSILLLVGDIGVAVGIWRLADHFNIPMFKYAALGILLGGVIGEILLIVATSRAAKMIRTRPDWSVGAPS